MNSVCKLYILCIHMWTIYINKTVCASNICERYTLTTSFFSLFSENRKFLQTLSNPSCNTFFHLAQNTCMIHLGTGCSRHILSTKRAIPDPALHAKGTGRGFGSHTQRTSLPAAVLKIVLKTKFESHNKNVWWSMYNWWGLSLSHSTVKVT